MELRRGEGAGSGWKERREECTEGTWYSTLASLMAVGREASSCLTGELGTPSSVSLHNQ